MSLKLTDGRLVGNYATQTGSATGVGGQGFIQLTEQGLTPGNAPSNGSRIFSRDNDSGKTQTGRPRQRGPVSR